MKKAAIQIAVCAVLLIMFCAVSRFVFFRDYTVYMAIPAGLREGEDWRRLRLEAGAPDVLRPGEVSREGDYLRVRIDPQRAGESDLTLMNADGEALAMSVLRVNPFHTVYDRTNGGFTGDSAVLVAATAFWLTVSAIMLWHFFRAKGVAFYSYGTIYFSGFSLFALVSGLLLLRITVLHITNPAQYNMFAAQSALSSASTSFMWLTMPLMFLFAVAMAVSNIELLRHEKPRPQNALGILVAVLLLAGEAVGLYLFTRNFSGAEWEARLQNTLQNTYATVFVYFECMLTGAIICGVAAARHWPAPDKDFIVILGCWFRKDGTLPPLLRGRVDRAIEFWNYQRAAAGKEAILIPSGGQGNNEPMPEADAIARYLLEQGIPDALICPDRTSMNTYQNMSHARAIIENIYPGGKTVFATTNYHVFRSGVWAANAGLRAEGIGGKTKWWFWPNAFMRECMGLLRQRWKMELSLLLALITFFVLQSMLLG